MHVNPSAIELTTSATDAILALLCFGIAWQLARMRVTLHWKRGLWRWVFGLLGLASALGAVAHGLDLSGELRRIVWWPLYLSLGLTVALFVLGGIYDWQGETTARALLPWGVGVGAGFAALTQALGGAFLVFVVYEAVAMAAALTIYVVLSTSGRRPGAGLMAAGIALSIAAAAVQASALRVHLFVPLDHNGLFHLVQMIAAVALAHGVRAGLQQRPQQ
jgi:hypothetical protein